MGSRGMVLDRLTTFSIAARCARSGQLGVAVSTAIPAVGMLCPYARAGVGAIATQSFLNPYLGIWGLDLLAEGKRASEVVAEVLRRDPDPAKRQLAIVDRWGGAAVHSGQGCDGWYGEVTGPNYAVAGNMLAGEETVRAMARTFEETRDLELAERLLSALEAGQAAGGDKRGRESAALLVVDEEPYPLLDLRVDQHADPVRELRRIYEVSRERLFPLLRKMPTKANPRGAWP